MLDYANPKLLIETAKLEPGEMIWRSPSNLALIKYWGKHGVQLPRNPSISITLNNAVTETKLAYAAKTVTDPGVNLSFFFHEEERPEFAEKIKKYLDSLLPIFPFLNQMDLTIHSGNSFPHSAGIASSASSMSALALCLCTLEDELFGTLNDDLAFDQKASYVARLGSGSACRSIYPHLSIWGKTVEAENSSDEFAIPFSEGVDPVFHTLHDDILIISNKEKSVSSTAGHGLMNENIYADNRYQQARQRLHHLLLAMKEADMDTVIRIVEDEALTLHALMMASNPSYLLMEPNTIAGIQAIRQFREETKEPIFFSLDAGPNLHVLYPESAMPMVRPFIEEQLVPLCQDGAWLPDWVGEGPEQI